MARHLVLGVFSLCHFIAPKILACRTVIYSNLVFFFFQAMRSTADTLKAIFISVGHPLTASLDTAIVIVKMSCRHPVPEPIRQVKPSTFFIDSQLESFKNHLRIFCYFMSAVSLTCNVKIIT